MIAIAAFSGHVQDVGRIGHRAIQPVGNVLAKTAAHFGFIAPPVGIAEFSQTGLGPIASWHHDFILKHLELLGLVELQQPLPGVAESVGPLAWITVRLMPGKFLRPQPSLLSHCEDEFEDIGVPFAVNDPLFYVEDEGAGGF